MKTLLLPSPCTLRRGTLRFQLMPGLNDFVFNFIQFKTNILIFLWDTISSDKLNNYVLYTGRINQDCFVRLNYKLETTLTQYLPIQFIHAFKK